MNEEIEELYAAGADIVQIGELYMYSQLEKARQHDLDSLNHAFELEKIGTGAYIRFGTRS